MRLVAVYQSGPPFLPARTAVSRHNPLNLVIRLKQSLELMVRLAGAAPLDSATLVYISGITRSLFWGADRIVRHCDLGYCLPERDSSVSSHVVPPADSSSAVQIEISQASRKSGTSMAVASLDRTSAGGRDGRLTVVCGFDQRRKREARHDVSREFWLRMLLAGAPLNTSLGGPLEED